MATDTLQPSFFERHRDRIAFAGPDDCWLWTGGTDDKGYGSVWARGKMRLAHREAYEAKNGAGSAKGLVVRHRCDTPLCVNHGHLLLGTQADNVRDMVERQRQARGAANGHAKLTEADVMVIRATHISGSSTHSHRALARQFGVRHAVIGKIIRRERWGHVS